MNRVQLQETVRVTLLLEYSKHYSVKFLALNINMMKTLLTLGLLLVFCVSAVNAQSRVRAKDLRGTWKLELEIDEEAETATERVILSAVDGLLDEIDIYMEFRKNNELKVTVHAFGDKEVEYSEWHINDKGELSLGESEHLQTGDSVWMFVGRHLESFEYKRNGKRVKESEHHYLRRVKR